MPIYEHRCEDCKKITVDITSTWKDRREQVICSGCGGNAPHVPSVPGAVYPPYPSVDGGEVWTGTPLEGTDGGNPVTFVSDKPFVDMGSG